MNHIKLACETYTWQMPGEQYKGKLAHIMSICAQAGFKGIEPETSFLQHLSDPIKMQDALEEYQLELAALCVVEDWKFKNETNEERKRTDGWIDFLKHFPDTILLSVQMPGANRDNLNERQQNMISCVNNLSHRAAEKGIVCSHHPNSPSGSLFRIDSDYEVLLNGLDLQATGYCPDVGHIAKGGMDPLSIIKKYREAINLVHYKDMYADGRWAATGEGDIDFTSITNYLVRSHYHGWIIMEDECDEAITNPDGLTFKDGEYIKKHISTLLK
jgi:inosose dehydratase